VYYTHSTGAHFPYFKKEEQFFNPSFRKEFNAAAMHTPVNNALTHNDFITAVQQRHRSY
jgi:hypothetical protein